MISSVLNYYEVQRLCFYATAKKFNSVLKLVRFSLFFDYFFAISISTMAVIAFLRLTDRLCIK